MIVLASTLSLLTALTLAVPTRRATSLIANIKSDSGGDLCIVPAGNVVGNGTPVQLAPCGDGGSPWEFDPDADTSSAFSLTGTNQCLDVTGGVNADGTRLQTWECTGGPNQQFTMRVWPSNFRSIQWTATNKCFDVTNGAFSAGTPIQFWDCDPNNFNQFFIFPPPRPIKFTTTAHPNLCINVAGASSADGTSLQIATCVGPTPLQQTFAPSAGGFHVFNNSAIDLTNGDQTNGNKLQIWTSFPGSVNQHWFYDATNNVIRLTANLNKCVDVTDGAFTDGTKLQIWDCTGGPNQQFTAVVA